MTARHIHTAHTRTEAETADLAQCFSNILAPGDTLLLEGDIGAGKTFFARALIQSLQDPPEDVPSPTFTLIQTYETSSGEIWHADLYRLNSSDEIVETGLLDAMSDVICLIEWPDRLGPDTPSAALTLKFTTARDSEDRKIELFTHDADRWAPRIKGVL